MPRYFFHHIDGHVEHDDEGIELESIRAARVAAVIFTGESLRDDPDQVCDGQAFRVEVADDRGTLLFSVVTVTIDAAPAENLMSSGPQ